VKFLGEKNGPPHFAEDVQSALEAVEENTKSGPEEEGWEDNLIPQALDIFRASRRISTSLLQRRLKIGYNRAARIMETLESKGLVPHSESLQREVDGA
jgi:S-DNA-T family DNA segregation ATPase FtsK/SpoIIIE